MQLGYNRAVASKRVSTGLRAFVVVEFFGGY